MILLKQIQVKKDKKIQKGWQKGYILKGVSNSLGVIISISSLNSFPMVWSIPDKCTMLLNKSILTYVYKYVGTYIYCIVDSKGESSPTRLTIKCLMIHLSCNLNAITCNSAMTSSTR